MSNIKQIREIEVAHHLQHWTLFSKVFAKRGIIFHEVAKYVSIGVIEITRKILVWDEESM